MNCVFDNLELYGAGSGKVSLSGLLWPTSDGSANQFLKTDGSGTLSFADLSIGDLDIVGSTISTPSNADLTLSPGGTGQVVVSQGAYTITVPNKTGTLAMDSDTSFPQSTITAAPGSSGNTDMGSVTDILTDAFAVAIADMFTCEEPLGSVQTTDLGAF